jgi:predicted N-acetyltransferase YhbS
MKEVVSLAKLTIRTATAADAAALAELMRQLGYPTTDAEMKARLRRILPRRDYRTVVALNGRVVVGMIGGAIFPTYGDNEPVGRIVALVVNAANQRKGVGRGLVRHLEIWFRRRGARRVVVNAALPRRQAHRFYRALGFTQTGLRFNKVLVLTFTRAMTNNIVGR